jgi:hypothetical protein
MAAILRGDTGDHDRVHAQAPEDDLQIGADEGAVPVLLNDDIARQRRGRRVDLGAG